MLVHTQRHRLIKTSCFRIIHNYTSRKKKKTEKKLTQPRAPSVKLGKIKSAEKYTNQLKLDIFIWKIWPEFSDRTGASGHSRTLQSTEVILMSPNNPEIHFLMLKCNMSHPLQTRILASNRGLGSVRRKGQRRSHETKWAGVRETPVWGLQPGHQRVIVDKLMSTW